VSEFYVPAANLIRIKQLKRGMLGRVDLQKTVYLSKQLGIYLPFEFRWDKLGPYSFELAHFVNQLIARNAFLIERGKYIINPTDPLVNRSASLTTINNVMEQKLAKLFASIRKTVHRNGFHIPTFMECLGSIHFIKTSLENYNKETVLHTLELLKPKRTHEFSLMKEEAWNLLGQNDL